MAGRENKLRTNDPAAMRRRVLDFAAEAFQAGGYHATSMHDVVRGAAITGGALYHHFPSKKALGLAVIAERVSPEVERTWIEVVRAAPTALDGVIRVFERVIAGLDAAGRVAGCPLNNLALELSLADPDFREAIEGEYRLWRQAIKDCIAAEIRSGGGNYANGDPHAFATYLIALFTGGIAISKAEQSTEALRACLARLQRLARG